MHEKPIDSIAPQTEYIPELDFFRFLAILSVMSLHWLSPSSWVNRLQDQFSNGVHLFFVLSGYLITGILLGCRADIERGMSTPSNSLRRFYARRMLRIFPLYYLSLIVGAAFHFQGLRSGFFWHLTYLSNVYYYLRQGFDGPASVFWTLAVEEQFYILWPTVILLLPKRAIFPVVIAIAVIGTACRIQATMTDSWSRILLPACVNFLAIGALGAICENTATGSARLRDQLLKTFGILIAVLAVLATALTFHIGLHAAADSAAIRAINQPMMAMLYLLLFSWAHKGMPVLLTELLRFSPFVYVGKISYGIYVYHVFVTFALWRIEHRIAGHIGVHGANLVVNSFIAKFALTVLLATISWQFFERPLNRLKRFFPYH